MGQKSLTDGFQVLTAFVCLRREYAANNFSHVEIIDLKCLEKSNLATPGPHPHVATIG